MEEIIPVSMDFYSSFYLRTQDNHFKGNSTNRVLNAIINYL